MRSETEQTHTGALRVFQSSKVMLVAKAKELLLVCKKCLSQTLICFVLVDANTSKSLRTEPRSRQLGIQKITIWNISTSDYFMNRLWRVAHKSMISLYSEVSDQSLLLDN